MATKKENGPTFILLFDLMVKEYGLTGAAIYGAVYRFSKMSNGCCYASQAKIAAMAGLKRKAANTYLKKLIEDGYLLENENPSRYSTKIYVPTDKLEKLNSTTKNNKDKINKVNEQICESHIADKNNKDQINKVDEQIFDSHFESQFESQYEDYVE